MRIHGSIYLLNLGDLDQHSPNLGYMERISSSSKLVCQKGSKMLSLCFQLLMITIIENFRLILCLLIQAGALLKL